MKWLRKLWREIEVGHARNTYCDLYEQGAISVEKYLEYMRMLDEELRKIRE